MPRSSHGLGYISADFDLQLIAQAIFTAQCTTVQSAVLLSHVVCPSVCLSACLSVCDVGGSWHWPHTVGWKSWEVIARTISPTSSLFVAQRSSTYSHGNREKFWGKLEVGWEKVACWSTKAGISLKRVKTEERLLQRAYRKSPTLFRFFWVSAIFLLPVSPLRPSRRPFLPFLPVQPSNEY